MKTILFIFTLLSAALVNAQNTLKGKMEVSYREYLPFNGSHIFLKNNNRLFSYNIGGSDQAKEVQWAPILFNTIPFQVKNDFYLETEGENYLVKAFHSHKTVLKVRTLWGWSDKGGMGLINGKGPRNLSFIYFDALVHPVDTLDKQHYQKLFPGPKKYFFDLLTSLDEGSGLLPFSEGMAAIKSPEGLFGYLNTSLALQIAPVYTNADSFFEGLAAVQNADDQWGFINKKGDTVIPFEYFAKPMRFSCGLARVTNNKGYHGYINKSNELVIPAAYRYATPFYKGHALARKEFNGPILLIDTKGKIIEQYDSRLTYLDKYDFGVPLHYHKGLFPQTLIQLMDKGKALFRKEGYYGILGINGAVLLDFDYNVLKDFHDGLMLARRIRYESRKTIIEDGLINENWEFIYLFKDNGF